MSLEASLQVLIVAGGLIIVPVYVAMLATFTSKDADVNVALVLNETFQGKARYKRGFRLLLVGLVMYAFSLPFRSLVPVHEVTEIYTIASNVLIFSHGYAFLKVSATLYSRRIKQAIKAGVLATTIIACALAAIAWMLPGEPVPVDNTRDLVGITWLLLLFPLPAGVVGIMNLHALESHDDTTLLSTIFNNLRLARISIMVVITYVLLIAVIVIINRIDGIFPLYAGIAASTLPMLYAATISLHVLLRRATRIVP